MCFGRHVDGLEFIYGGHACQFERIEFICFAFDITPLPSVFVGGADDGFKSESNG